MCCMHHVFHYVMFKTVRNWLYIFIFLIHFYTVNVESGRKEQSLFQTSIPFFRGIQTRFFKCLKISWLRVRTTRARGPPPCISHPVRTAFSVIWHFHDIQCQCPNSCSFPLTEVHWAWLNTSKSVQVLVSIATLPPVFRLGLAVDVAELQSTLDPAPVSNEKPSKISSPKHRWNFTSFFSAAGNQNVASASIRYSHFKL